MLKMFNLECMKKYLFSLLAVLIVMSALAQDRQAILNVMSAQQHAWNRGDLNAFMQGYWKSDSLMFVGKKGPNYGWQTTLDHYKKGYPDKSAMGQLSFGIKKVEVLDKTNAFVFGSWQVKRTKDVLSGYFTLWFRKINGQWKIVVDHTS